MFTIRTYYLQYCGSYAPHRRRWTPDAGRWTLDEGPSTPYYKLTGGLKNQNNLKQSWKIINEVINEKKNSLNSKEFLINNETVTDKKAIADSFNQYFINLASSLSENTPNSQLDPIKYIKNSPQKSLFLTDITRSELKIIISLLKNSSAGYGEIHSKIIKLSYEYYLEPLLHTFNLSLCQGVFPNELKVAKVVPIYKGQSSN